MKKHKKLNQYFVSLLERELIHSDVSTMAQDVVFRALWMGEGSCKGYELERYLFRVDWPFEGWYEKPGT